MYKRGAASLVHLLKTYKEKEKSKVKFTFALLFIN